MIIRALKVGFIALVVMIIAAAGYVLIMPPDLLKVATNYSAKIVCSNVFIAGRDAEETLRVDVQAPGHPLLKYVSIDVDQSEGMVTAKLLGVFAPAQSKFRAGLGCSNFHDSRPSNATSGSIESADEGLWPYGEKVNLSQDPELLNIVSDEALLGEGFRALVVVKDGRIVAERYGDGFGVGTPLLGWSMTKSVTAGIIGTLIKSGKLSLADTLTGSYEKWNSDARKNITIENMLSMSSGLQWNEGYGSVSDVTRMLFLVDDMAGFAAQLPPEEDTDAFFNYSSGTSTMLARVWQDVVGEGSLDYPREQLFEPIGMTSAIMETDAKDTFVGSSYMYATAQDWARYGQFLLQKGVWRGQQLLPVGFTDWMFEPTEASNGQYTKGHLWRQVPGEKPPLEDGIWMAGHDGQSIGIFPSRDLVVVRLGLTPSKLGYSPRPLAEAIISTVGG